MEAVEKADEGNSVFCGFSDGCAAAGAAAAAAFDKNLDSLRDHQISLVQIHHYALGACVPCE